MHFLNELKDEAAPVDDFKKNRKLRLNRIGEEEKKWDKPNSKPLLDDVDALKPKTSNAYNTIKTSINSANRLSDVYSKPSQKEQKTMQELKQSQDAYFSEVPLYSSFAKDKVFPMQPGDKASVIKTLENKLG